MTDIIERVARGIYDTYEKGGKYPQSPYDFSMSLATAALEELAKGLVWENHHIKLNGIYLGTAFAESSKKEMDARFRKKLFGLGPKEG